MGPPSLQLGDVQLADQFACAAEDGLRQMTATGMRETFVLQALAALPTEFREVIFPALVKPYLHMGLPRSSMIAVARQSGERTAVLRWLAKFTGITEWELDWEAKYPVYIPGEAPAARERAPAEAPVRQQREQAEVSDADSSDGGVISEGTDNDEESADAARNEESANRSRIALYGEKPRFRTEEGVNR
ncbi:unnamed protein product [Symbiodinium natans]|uniref:Uncharacterized protein n=1 Tax=Symbiodinium natans TaxID=878477 RepID=A0A812IBI2_9DINO|nr:unnamed protein product [Symbiodinium natans]